jgi:hypothetical protein
MKSFTLEELAKHYELTGSVVNKYVVESDYLALVAQVQVLQNSITESHRYTLSALPSDFVWPPMINQHLECLRQIQAEAGAKAVAECLRIVEQTKTTFNQLSRYHRGVDITPSKFKENAILELKRYASRIRQGGE